MFFFFFKMSDFEERRSCVHHFVHQRSQQSATEIKSRQISLICYNPWSFQYLTSSHPKHRANPFAVIGDNWRTSPVHRQSPARVRSSPNSVVKARTCVVSLLSWHYSPSLQLSVYLGLPAQPHGTNVQESQVRIPVILDRYLPNHNCNFQSKPTPG